MKIKLGFKLLMDLQNVNVVAKPILYGHLCCGVYPSQSKEIKLYIRDPQVFGLKTLLNS